MTYTNNGYFEIPEEYEEEFLDLADKNGFGDCLDIRSEKEEKIIFDLNECPGDIEMNIARVAEHFVGKGLNASVEYFGDESGRYEVEDGEFYSYSGKECILRDASDEELIAELKRRRKFKNVIHMDTERKCAMWMYYNPDSESGGQYVVNVLPQDVFFSFIEKYGFSDELFQQVSIDAKQYLIDKGTEYFEVIDKKFR